MFTSGTPVALQLCKLSRRPEMRGAEDIGTWEKIFTTLGLLAVISNAAVICFTSRTFVSDNDIRLFFDIREDASNAYGDKFTSVASVRVWMFNLFLVVVLGTKWVIGYVSETVFVGMCINRARVHTLTYAYMRTRVYRQYMYTRTSTQLHTNTCTKIRYTLHTHTIRCVHTC
jgi:hypothetical protein